MFEQSPDLNSSNIIHSHLQCAILLHSQTRISSILTTNGIQVKSWFVLVNCWMYATLIREWDPNNQCHLVENPWRKCGPPFSVGLVASQHGNNLLLLAGAHQHFVSAITSLEWPPWYAITYWTISSPWIGGATSSLSPLSFTFQTLVLVVQLLGWSFRSSC